MGRDYREHLDSREAFSADEETAYHEDSLYDPTDDDLAEMESYWPDDYDDYQPSEYDEWQDYYDGDDWDHGQYDDY